MDVVLLLPLLRRCWRLLPLPQCGQRLRVANWEWMPALVLLLVVEWDLTAPQ